MVSISSCESVFLLYLIGVIASSRLPTEAAGLIDEVDDEFAWLVLPPFLKRISGMCGLTCLNGRVVRVSIVDHCGALWNVVLLLRYGSISNFEIQRTT